MRKDPSEGSFEFAPSPGLIGIAKLAASSEVLEEKRRVEYRELESRTFIGRCSSPRMPFRWTLNPYRGCEFGCKYCYARYAHEFMELRDHRDFEQKIFAKAWDEEGFRREIAKVPRGETLCLGTATDPYQPAERRFGVTRKMLQVLTGLKGCRLWVTTKSDLVARDLDLFQRIAQANYVQVGVTVTTADERLARLVEPFAPRPSLRLAAVRKLVDGGVRCGVLAHPIMPLINDSERALDRLGSAVADAGAAYLSAAVLFLKPCAQAAFFPFLETNFPHLLRRYKERYERSAYLRGEYPEMIRKRIDAVRGKYKLNQRLEEYLPEYWPQDDQLMLF